MIAGKKITLGGREFEAPPVPFAVIRKHIDVFEGRQQPSLLDMGDIIFLALKRNYPELTQEELDGLLDRANMLEAFNTVMLVSGTQEKLPGEAAPGSP